MKALRETVRSYPAANRGTVIVWGMIAAYPFGGMTWQGLQYLAGLRQLGFDVWYVEDSNIGVLDPNQNWPSADIGPNVRFLEAWMQRIGLAQRWAFCPPDHPGECMGSISSTKLASLYSNADAVFNLCGSHGIREEHQTIRCLVYVQTDPMADQVLIANGDRNRQAKLDAHHVHFTYAENLYASDCMVPKNHYHWLTTRPPVVTEWWRSARGPTNPAFTTITNWKRDFGKDVEYQGRIYHWNKRDEIERFAQLPGKAPQPMEMAISAIDDRDKACLRAHGWRLRAATDVSDPASYRDYVRNSYGEFTVAKEQYTAPKTGWFSDRSACYLAAGRPVITQDTGFPVYIPSGSGLFAFDKEPDALAAMDTIHHNYAAHCSAAVDLANEYFRASKVVGAMARDIGLL